MTLLGPFSFGPWLDSALEPAALQPNASEIRSAHQLTSASAYGASAKQQKQKQK